MSDDKAKRQNKPKGALRCAICADTAVDETLESLNASAKDGTEWKQDKATLRARKLAETGQAHLCMFQKK
jgi:hypothetical protein